MIRVLEDHVINKIAAGEVVERPASVLKELLENAIDASSTRIGIELRAGGRNLVKVVDDGVGMHNSDATLSLERHATSKIRTDQDLFQVSSLGFRGEALPSIAAVSQFEMCTRRPEDDVGTKLVVQGGRLDRVMDVGGPPGTQISVRKLFYNVPARRKFLRTVTTELSHCLEAVVRPSLVCPALDIEVVHDGRTVIRAPSVSSMAERAADILGAAGEVLVPIEFEHGGVRVHALLSPVGVHRSNPRGSTYLYVNGRFVRDPLVRKAVNAAYSGLVPKGRYPTVVVAVHVPPSTVDVNVHPAKTEVRFQDGHNLVRSITRGLREGLEQHGIKMPMPQNEGYSPRAPVPPATQGDFQKRQTTFEQHNVRSSDGGMAQRAYSSSDVLQTSGTPQKTHFPDPATSGIQTMRPDGPVRGAQVSTDIGRELLPVPRFSDLRVIGQLGLTYILCEGDRELVIIDQHAAHERITLHRILQSARTRLGAGQRLLTPPVVELSPAKAAFLIEHIGELAGYGLEIEPFGGQSFAIKQVPEAIKGADLTRLIEDIADDIADGGRGGPLQDLTNKILDTMACHNSIRAGQTLSNFEMRELLSALDQVDFSVCAHGRPVALRVSPRELEQRFHRS